jgi:hypothetical protein
MKLSDKELLAEKLNGREYGNEILPKEEAVAKEEGLVVLFGESDDLCELRGAIYDEIGAYHGATLFIKDGRLLPPIDDDDIEVLKRYNVLETVQSERNAATQISIFWCKTKEYAWTFETAITHATFDIMDDGKKFCRGIIIDLKELGK